MLAKESNSSYSEEFRRKRTAEKLLPRANGGQPNLLTDRQAYISYLEVQLDRVTASCMAVQAFSDRIQQVQEHATLNESRLQNLTQEMHLSMAERDRQVEKLESLDKRIQERMQAVEDRCRTLESQIKGVIFDVPDIETQIHRIVKVKLESILSDNEDLEQKLIKLVNQRIDTLSQSQSDFERRLTLSMNNNKDYFESTIRNSEKHLAMAWENSTGDLNTRIEKIKQEIVQDLRQQMCIDEIHKSRELQSRRLVQLQEQMSSFRPGLTTHLNNLSTKLSSLENKTNDRDRTIQNIEARVKSAEQICSRIAHDTLKKVEIHQQDVYQRLKDISRNTNNDSFQVEMRNELHHWEEAMSSLIRNTERQLKKLADSMTVTASVLPSNSENESRRRFCNSASRIATKSTCGPEKLRHDRVRANAKQHPSWLEVLSKWKAQRSPRQSLSSVSSSMSSHIPIAEDNRNIENYESNINAIEKTIEQLDYDCQRESDYMTAPIRQLGNTECKKSVTKKPKKSPETAAISQKVLASSRKRLQPGVIRTVKR